MEFLWLKKKHIVVPYCLSTVICYAICRNSDDMLRLNNVALYNKRYYVIRIDRFPLNQSKSSKGSAPEKVIVFK